jgi:hypothetical protein
MAASSHMRRAAHLTEMFAMASASTNAFAIGATVLGGLLAGPAVNRVLVELPAWALDGNATFWKHAMANSATRNGMTGLAGIEERTGLPLCGVCRVPLLESGIR